MDNFPFCHPEQSEGSIIEHYQIHTIFFILTLLQILHSPQGKFRMTKNI